MNPSAEWLALVSEPIIDPEREIVDPHHHLWDRSHWRYLLPEFRADTDAGHKVVQSVYVECRSSYLTEGPEHLYPVGETIFAAALARESEQSPGAQIAGIVAHADLRQPQLAEVLDAHEAAGGGLFRGIRHAGARDPEPQALTIPGRGAEGQYADPAFRRGVALLGERGLSFDTWHYHHQNPDFAALARAVPHTTMILDHFGTPLGVGRHAGRREAIFEQWRRDIEAIAACPNVVAKLGGLAMPDNGFGWNGRERPADSDEFVEAQARYYHHAIDCFGADRCMFESNFPVDSCSISYPVLWNALKKIASRYTEQQRQQMFSGTARRVYRLPPPADAPVAPITGAR